MTLALKPISHGLRVEAEGRGERRRLGRLLRLFQLRFQCGRVLGNRGIGSCDLKPISHGPCAEAEGRGDRRSRLYNQFWALRLVLDMATTDRPRYNRLGRLLRPGEGREERRRGQTPLQRGEDMAPVNCKEENSLRESDCAIHSVRRLLPAD